jgi:hypothetical protein
LALFSQIKQSRDETDGYRRFGSIMPLFFIYIFFNSFIQYNHTFIHPSPFAEARLLVSSSLLHSAREEPPWGAEPKIELRPALEQADALPTELRRTLN